MTAGGDPRELSAWGELERHRAAIGDRHLRDLFADDPERGERLVASACGLRLDFSKHRITDETLMLLEKLAAEAGIAERREAMFAGEHINVTEDRAVLHVALRAPRSAMFNLDGRNVVPEVHAVLEQMMTFAGKIRSGEWRGKQDEAHVEQDRGGATSLTEAQYQDLVNQIRKNARDSGGDPNAVSPRQVDGRQGVVFEASAKSYSGADTKQPIPDVTVGLAPTHVVPNPEVFDCMPLPPR